jgi:hypothetical protein
MAHRPWWIPCTQKALVPLEGYFCLTGDESNFYPDGVSRVEIRDGLSQGKATIEFDHNTTDKTVTITITAHSSESCNIRDLTEFQQPFPNTICFAL